MGYFGQLLLQALIMAGLGSLVFYSPWPVLRVLGALVILWVIWGILRNPIYFYRRLLRLIVLSALPFIVAGLSFRINGRTALPWGGEVAFEIEQGSSASLFILLGLVGACVLADALITLLESRRNARFVPPEAREAPLFRRSDGSIEMVCRLLVTAQEPIAISEAKLGMAGLWPARFTCSTHVPDGDEPERPIVPGRPLCLTAGGTKDLRLSAKLGRGAYARWIRIRLWTPLAVLAPMRAVIELVTNLGGAPLRAPLILRSLTSPAATAESAERG